MKTINTILPIYDSLEKQDKNRTGTQMPVLTPRFRLPAFQWKDDVDGAATVSTVELINNKGKVEAIPLGYIGWKGSPVSEVTITANGLEASRVQMNGACSLVTTTAPLVKVGEIILTRFVLTKRVLIPLYLQVYEDSSLAGQYLLSEGENTISHTVITPDPSGYCKLEISIYSPNINDDADFSLSDVTIGYPSLNYSLQALPASHALTSDVYFQYKGTTLVHNLPLGTYYLKITMNTGNVYYSDYFVVTDIYENQITSWTNVDFGSFTSAKEYFLYAITASGKSAKSNAFAVKIGTVINVKLCLIIKSGTAPNIVLKNAAGTVVSSVIALSAGINEKTLTSTYEGDVYLSVVGAGAGVIGMYDVLALKSYSQKFTRIDFNDTHDLGDILYHDSFIDTCFLEAKLNLPTHEVVEVGEEKNGIFITEKLVTKYKYKIIANIGRQLYTALMRLPQHDTITITDEVGNVYTPKIGNIWVSQPNWIFYDVCRLEIQFNDNSEFVWTSENNNLT